MVDASGLEVDSTLAEEWPTVPPSTPTRVPADASARPRHGRASSVARLRVRQTTRPHAGSEGDVGSSLSRLPRARARARRARPRDDATRIRSSARSSSSDGEIVGEGWHERKGGAARRGRRPRRCRRARARRDGVRDARALRAPRCDSAVRRCAARGGRRTRRRRPARPEPGARRRSRAAPRERRRRSSSPTASSRFAAVSRSRSGGRG